MCVFEHVKSSQHLFSATRILDSKQLFIILSSESKTDSFLDTLRSQVKHYSSDMLSTNLKVVDAKSIVSSVSQTMQLKFHAENAV